MLETYTYPSGFTLKYVYNNLGFMTQVRRNDNNSLLWQATEQNQRGQLTRFGYGNGDMIAQDYDRYGFPSRYAFYNQTTGGVDRVNIRNYMFNSATGNLNSQTDHISGQWETYEYDDQQLGNRLLSWKIKSTSTTSMNYAPSGNISRKTDVSNKADSYIYNSYDKPHAVKEITEPTTEFLSASYQQDVTYTPFNKVSKISNTTLIPRFKLSFTYGPDNQRKQSRLYRESPSVPDVVKFFLDQYEETYTYGSNSKIHYLNGPQGVFGILTMQGSSETMYYVHTDYLGSYTYITDEDGELAEVLSYDPWGRRRNAYDWTDYNVAPTRFDRGYTGHEHLGQFGLINMNGRVYDPFLARFLSPDPQLQSPDYSQNYNRYSYAWNNPLKYTDPSGEFIFTALALLIPGAQFLLPVAIGADIGALTGGIRGANSDVGFWAGAGRGALVGAVGGTLAMYGGGTFIANVAWGMGQGTVTGGLDAALWGNDIGQGMLYGAAIGGVFAMATSGYEAFGNYDDYERFGTNVGVFNRMAEDVQNAYLNNNFTNLQSSLQTLNEFSADRFGLFSNFQFGGTQSAAATDGNASIGLFDLSYSADGSKSLIKRGGAAIRRSMSHEGDHISNLMVRVDGKGPGSEIYRSFNRGRALYINDFNHGTVGYYAPIRNAGKLHIGRFIVEESRPGTGIAWKQFGWKKWFHLIPRRF